MSDEQMSTLPESPWQRILNEPVAISGFVQILLAWGMAFGLDWTGEQVAQTMALTQAALIVLVRMFVTPNQRAEARHQRGASPIKASPAETL